MFFVCLFTSEKVANEGLSLFRGNNNIRTVTWERVLHRETPLSEAHYRISGNFQGIYISRISLVEAPIVKLKKMLSIVAIREIKIN